MTTLEDSLLVIPLLDHLNPVLCIVDHLLGDLGHLSSHSSKSTKGLLASEFAMSQTEVLVAKPFGFLFWGWTEVGGVE